MWWAQIHMRKLLTRKSEFRFFHPILLEQCSAFDGLSLQFRLALVGEIVGEPSVACDGTSITRTRPA